ncbi:MAG TPA: cupredoxin domain-containing protein [Burkholderiaceae bacterium]|nr:cupredoxin domain-containing protein [Burkholderiaceae bacterium]
MLRAALLGTAAVLVRAGWAQPAAPRVIQMVARRFVYEPNEIELKVGERVVIEIKSLDFVHGMNIPDLKQRLDLVPGRITRLELQPQAAGEIEFVCDNFCGDGHETMHGRFVVRA